MALFLREGRRARDVHAAIMSLGPGAGSHSPRPQDLVSDHAVALLRLGKGEEMAWRSLPRSLAPLGGASYAGAWTAMP
jgi:hypothetical protein